MDLKLWTTRNPKQITFSVEPLVVLRGVLSDGACLLENDTERHGPHYCCWHTGVSLRSEQAGGGLGKGVVTPPVFCAEKRWLIWSVPARILQEPSAKPWGRPCDNKISQGDGWPGVVGGLAWWKTLLMARSVMTSLKRLQTKLLNDTANKKKV